MNHLYWVRDEISHRFLREFGFGENLTQTGTKAKRPFRHEIINKEFVERKQ